MIKNIFVILLAMLTLNNVAQAQEKNDQRTVTTRIADLLAQMPAEDAKLLDNNMKDLAQLGEDGYVTLITKLAAPGQGDNSRLEYAIGGFSAYVSQKGKENWRVMAANAYCKALPKLTNPQNKSFIISQLELVGDDAAVSYLQEYLTDPLLADPAGRALVKINTVSSKTALLNALKQANGPAKLSLIEALGDSRFKEASHTINALALNSDSNTEKSSLYALAYIADPSSESILASAAERSKYRFENTYAAAAYLIYAEQLMKNGNVSLAKQVGKKILDKTTADDQVGFRTGALKILVESDKENNQEILLKAAGDKNAIYRATALKYAVPYVTAASIGPWIKKLGQVDDDAKADIVYMFGESGVKEALPAVLKLFKNKKVKIAAINAATNIGQDQVLGDLLKAMSKGDTTDVAAISGAINRMKGNGIAQRVANAIPGAKPNVQIALINIIASRAANAEISTVYNQLKNKNPEVQQAAYKALSHVVVKDDLPKLFSLLNETSGEQESAIQAAIIAAVNGSEENSQQVDAVLQQMAASPENKKLLFYKVLASLGGQKALKTVSDAYHSGNEQTQKAAIVALSTWVDGSSASELIKIARETKNAEFLNTAIDGYLSAIKGSVVPAEQKLLLLRNAMEVAQNSSQKNKILKATEQAKSFNAIVFAGKYLDDVALQQAAANAVMNITLAGDYNGDLIIGLLNKSIEVITGGDSGYQKEAMRKYISQMKPGTGFVQMFDGTTLEGWKGLVADPIKRSKMSAKTLEAQQEKADAEMVNSWKVVNGELHFTGHGNNIATVKKYGDFEMLVDWKIIDDKKGEGDAGIYLRGTPQVQIWDNARIKDGAQVGSGGLYNNQINESKPLKVADNKLDEWNTFRILMKGDRVTVYLNGVLVTDNVILENYWDKNMAIFAEEQIELQAHGSPVAYRDIYIKELPKVKPFELSAQEKKEGYKVLFDGTNMHNWMGNMTDYTIEDGTIAIRPKPGKGSGGNLFTKEEFSDFIYRFEFQLTPGANNGLGIRAPLKGDAAYEGMELQILDNDAPIYKDLHIYQYHGSIYGAVPAKRGFLKPVGEWNYQEVIAKGPKIKVILNGTVILDADITEARKNGAADGKPHPGLMRKSGHIGFLGHGSPVQFRNIRIKDLSKK
ncbi:family 16 glycoside hydrolase [Pedobacter sp.]|uniref:family 16 glycoside hydrolase n=1 Tax=Pedobacter sp. TaxID=1411316 RepID=UPI003D7F6D22